MDKKLVLVGMENYKTAMEFMCAVTNGLCEDGISVKMPEDIRMCIETPHAQIVFVYNPEYQNLRNLGRADALFGLPQYAKPLRAYLKADAVYKEQPTMGLRTWIVEHEHSSQHHDQYVRQDIASTALAAVVKRATEVLYGNHKFPEIKCVHFSGPVTCVIWDDGTKTLVRCGENDIVDPEKGLAMAIAKKALGTNKTGSNYYRVFKKWLPETETVEKDTNPDDWEDILND